MAPELKFCGLTRAEDVMEAARVGARYVGVIFAGGPRRLTAERALEVLEYAPRTVARVGVFGAVNHAEIGHTAAAASLDVVQLHGDPAPDDIDQARRAFGGKVWAVLRCTGSSLPAGAHDVFLAADAVVLDARVDGQLGGTGVTLDWARLADEVSRLRESTPVVLAGGLTPLNVADAVGLVGPDVVDVSSGVETAPGIKDHRRMRAFAEAVGAARAT